jgi:hypothetical protein
MHKLEQDDIDTTLNTPYEPLSDKKILRPFGIVIQYDRKTKHAIDEDEIEDQSITRMIDAFRFITRCKKEINCLSFLKKIIRNRTYLWYYSCHTKSVSLEFTHQKHGRIVLNEVKPIAIKESQQRYLVCFG